MILRCENIMPCWSGEHRNPPVLAVINSRDLRPGSIIAHRFNAKWRRPELPADIAELRRKIPERFLHNLPMIKFEQH